MQVQDLRRKRIILDFISSHDLIEPPFELVCGLEVQFLLFVELLQKFFHRLLYIN